MVIKATSLTCSLKNQKAGPSIRSVNNLTKINMNNIGALFKQYARINAKPTARFLAV